MKKIRKFRILDLCLRAVGLGDRRSAPAQGLWVYLFAFHVCWYRGISSDRKLSPGISRWLRSTSYITRLARATSSIRIQRFYAPRTCCAATDALFKFEECST